MAMANATSIRRRLGTNSRERLPPVGRVKVSYKCPMCDSENQSDLMYIPHKRGQKHPATSSSYWCSRCGARHIIDYRVFKRRDGTPRIKVYHFKAGEEEFVKRFKVLAWC